MMMSMITRMKRLYEKREGEKQMRVWKIIAATILIGFAVIVFLNPVLAPVLMLMTSLIGIVISIIMNLLGK